MGSGYTDLRVIILGTAFVPQTETGRKTLKQPARLYTLSSITLHKENSKFHSIGKITGQSG